jgi:hypothetical protein
VFFSISDLVIDKMPEVLHSICMAKKRKVIRKNSARLFEKHPDMQWLVPMALLIVILVVFFLR